MSRDDNCTPWTHLGSYTDEDLLVLAGPDDGAPSDLVVAPYAVDLDEHDTLVATKTALRGLLARGCVAPGPGAQPVATGDAALVVDLRTQAQRVLAARITYASPGGIEYSFRYVFVLADVALVEDVDAAGIHHMRLGSTAMLAGDMASRLVLDDAHDGTAPVRGEAAVLRAVSGAHVAADLVVRYRPTDTQIADGERERDIAFRQVFTGPDGSWVDAEGPDLSLRPVAADEVGSWAAELVLADAPTGGTIAG